MKKEILRWGYFCDLDQAEKAYSIMNVQKSHHDYANANGEDWDEDAFYNDFAKWWTNLNYDTKVKLYAQLN